MKNDAGGPVGADAERALSALERRQFVSPRLGLKLPLLVVLFVSLLTATLPRVGQAQVAPANAAPAAPTITITRASALTPQPGPADHFTGTPDVTQLFGAQAPSHVSGGSVTFPPGARSAWHSHPLGQVLLVTAGTGWIQSWDGPIQEMHQGDVVRIPPGVKHWHGAGATTSVTHIAIQEELDGKNTDWMEKVSDEQYRLGPSATTTQEPTKTTQSINPMSNKEPSAIKKTYGDFSPKLVEVTDDVLFGDVWERPELSKRDRSLVTVTALVVGGHTEQLPFHLKRAKENGVTEAEIIETITHLAFYGGWPKAMSALAVAKDTFQPQP